MVRSTAVLFVAVLPAFAHAQPVEAKAKTAAFVAALYDPEAGAFKPTPTGKPSLRATNAGVRVLKYLGAEVPATDKLSAFVLSCHDPETGGFAEPGTKPNVVSTAVGVMAAAELGIPKDKYRKAMTYLNENAKTFEDVRIAAAAVEARGVADCPFPLAPWAKLADDYILEQLANPDTSGTARAMGSWAAMKLRLGRVAGDPEVVLRAMNDGQKADGGWGEFGASASDLGSTYRVMRAFKLLKTEPAKPAAVRDYLARHRNADGGYATAASGPSDVAGTYHAVIVSKWLDELEKE